MIFRIICIILCRCVYLLAELSQIPEAVSSVATALPLVAEACRHRHYTQHMTFLETVCKQLPLLAKGLGKKVFKTVLEDFFEPIFYALVSYYLTLCISDDYLKLCSYII